jgi:hypothetical protein
MNRFKILKNPNIKPCFAPQPEFPKVVFKPETIEIDENQTLNFTITMSGQWVGVSESPGILDTSSNLNSGTESSGISGGDPQPCERSSGRTESLHPESWTRHRRKLPWE